MVIWWVLLSMLPTDVREDSDVYCQIGWRPAGPI
jgi:hypothetical protein